MKSLEQNGRQAHPKYQQQQKENHTHPRVVVDDVTVDQTVDSHDEHDNTSGSANSPHYHEGIFKVKNLMIDIDS